MVRDDGWAGRGNSSAKRGMFAGWKGGSLTSFKGLKFMTGNFFLWQVLKRDDT